jgi:ATP-dependent helicase/nuclease subunit A
VVRGADGDDVRREAIDLHRLCASWPDPDRHIANLDSLRALVLEYEELCRVRHGPCTLAGLVLNLRAQSRDGWRDPEHDRQAIPADQAAVTISTYHRAKGLEWPIVVLTSLDFAFLPPAFGLWVESDSDAFSSTDL